MELSVVILAAGKGRRMSSSYPKAMHELAGVPLLERVIHTAKSLSPSQIHVVYGNCRGALRERFFHLGVNWVDQKEQLGTGHAVKQALAHIDRANRVLVLYGDVPAISTATLQSLLNRTPREEIGVLTATLKDPAGFGRIVRDQSGSIEAIVEHADANTNQLNLHEVNTGILCCSASFLNQALPLLRPHNNQGEFYLTDIIALAVANQVPITSVCAPQAIEIQGVNDLWQLVQLERQFQVHQAKRLALSGVRVLDPARLDLRGHDIHVGKDTKLDVGVILEGPVNVGKNCVIGAYSLVKGSNLGDNVTVLPHSVIEGAEIAQGCTVGPFARLRVGTVLAAECQVGNFVEIKKAHLGKGTKASHLSYLGDAAIGPKVNIGAGTITCNYDGTNKWQTIIKEGAFVGSNTSLVAPVVIGEHATIGAGSTITRDAPDHQLTVARARQASLANWQRPPKKLERSDSIEE